MSCVRVCALVFIPAALFWADNGPAWKNKHPEQWDGNDARQFLVQSPWVGRAELQVIPSKSPDQRRDSGDWDALVGRGVGLEGTGILGHERMELALARAHTFPSPGMVDVRWDSARPVRMAEAKLGLKPSLNYADWYVITVYNVPLPESHWGASRLKNLAYLRRAGKKDFRPSKAEVLRNDDGTATVSFLFSRSEEITRRDKTVIFVAQFERLFVSQFFYPWEMLVSGDLEL